MEKTENDESFYINRSPLEDINCALEDAAKSHNLNVGLYIDKFVAWKEGKEIDKCSPRTQIEELKKSCNIGSKRLSIPPRLFPLELYNTYKKRRSYLFSDLRASGYTILSKKKDILWRLIMNFGAASVYETSLLLHRNYSIPFISGSSIKGVTYNHVIQEKIKNIDVKKVFGDENQKGTVIFFDAYPIIDNTKDFFVLDIMNVHYQEYYQEKNPPGDWMDPNPVFFFALENIEFEFTIASRDSILAENVLKLVGKAISSEGIGSKTSIGYGYFSEE